MNGGRVSAVVPTHDRPGELLQTLDGLARLEGLMEEADTELLKWVMGQETPPATVDTELLGRLIAFRKTSARSK